MLSACLDRFPLRIQLKLGRHDERKERADEDGGRSSSPCLRRMKGHGGVGGVGSGWDGTWWDGEAVVPVEQGVGSWRCWVLLFRHDD